MTLNESLFPVYSSFFVLFVCLFVCFVLGVLNIHRSAVWSLCGYMVPHETAAAISGHVLCTPYTYAPVYSVFQSRVSGLSVSRRAESNPDLELITTFCFSPNVVARGDKKHFVSALTALWLAAIRNNFFSPNAVA